MALNFLDRGIFQNPINNRLISKDLKQGTVKKIAPLKGD